MDAVRDERVRIVPPRYGKGYLDWLAEKRDWPVSRQLWWGHRIPIWSKVCPDKETVDALVEQLDCDALVVAGRVTYQVELDAERQAAIRHGGAIRGAAKVGLPFGTVHVCIDREDEELAARFESLGFVRDEDVLDTWFSSALWPHSTLGWPEASDELSYYYPTATLITSRDIITLWVARMVLAGLNNMGEVPFREVYIHPKILDGYGETMSKSKGNGVDPIDVIDKFGPDALRFGIAYLTGDNQDVRMPVQFECPHCQTLIDQTQKNRRLPRVGCKKCGGAFSTQWAEKPDDRALPRGAVVSERFELARNFCNKLWNASRFVLMNLAGFEPGTLPEDELHVEDRWILSRLSTVTWQVTDCLETYRYSEAARAIYEFAWDEFCSFYVEMVKGRLADESARALAQRVLAHTLDAMLRLLHPMIPFITEEVWQLLGKVAPSRGPDDERPAAESIMIAPWPEVDQQRRDERIEARFRQFQAVLGALREIRSRQGIPPKTGVEFLVECDAENAELLEPMEPYFASMANAKAVGWGSDVEPPATNAQVSLPGMDVFIDLKDFIDVDAEIARNEKQVENLKGMIQGKQKKLANDKFVQRAPEEVVQRERDGLEQLEQQLASVESALAELKKDA